MTCSAPAPSRPAWRRILLERLDALAVIYRLAAVLSGVAYPIRLRWYRASPLDAAVSPARWQDPGHSAAGTTPPTVPPSPTGCGSCARDRCPLRCWC